MRPPATRPAGAFVFVCTNRRPASNPLGAGCADQGEALHQGLRQEITRRGASARLWLARASCLGLCPREGAAAVVCDQPFTEVSPAEAPRLIDLALSPRRS